MAKSGRRSVVCDLGGRAPPDLRTVDALSRLQLAARRLGLELRLRGGGGELEALLELCGLVEALGVEPRRQPEEREERLGVEEEGELGDPAL